MDIPRSSTPISLALLTAAAPALASAWRAGAMIEALVISADPTKSMARLSLQGAQVEVRSEVPLRAGERLLLTAEPRQGQWLLTRREAPPPAPLEQAWRQVLPRQQPLAPALRTLSEAAKLPTLPPPVRAALAMLAARLPTPQHLATPAGVRQGVQESGIFLEARLAALQTQPHNASGAPAARMSAPAPASPSGFVTPPMLATPRVSATPSASPTPSAATAPTVPVAVSVPAGAAAASGAAPSAAPVNTPSVILPGATGTPAPPSPAPPVIAGGAEDATITAIASTSSAMAGDMKGLLLRLLHLLRAPASAVHSTTHDHQPGQALETLRGLARHAESAVARIEFQQFRALPEHADADPAWVLELPFRQGEDVETLTLRIRRDQEQDNAPEGVWPWTITLELGDSASGPLRAVVALRDKTVSTRFFATRTELAERIGNSLDVLDTRLRAAGLQVQTLEAHVGRAVSEEPLPGGLLKERV